MNLLSSFPIYLLPHLTIKPVDETITVFPVCSMKKMGLDRKLAELARICAKNVIIPDTNCCGFAGDRGFTYPELNKHGLRNLKIQITGTVTDMAIPPAGHVRSD